MRRRAKSERETDECPECGTTLQNTDASIYICRDAEEALRIVAILQRSVIVKIGDTAPRRVYIDGTYSTRGDIMPDKAFGGDYWYTGNGLRLEAVRLSWGGARK